MLIASNPASKPTDTLLLFFIRTPDGLFFVQPFAVYSLLPIFYLRTLLSTT
jgi:hypothetical protein